MTDWPATEKLVAQAAGEFGRLDIVVNNAGILRDRMLFSMTEEEFDAVIAVHLKGTFAMTRHACAYWRAEAKRGEGRGGRIINTTSGTGLFGTAGQANYGAAKAGIISLTTIAAMAPGEIRDTAGHVGRGLELHAEASRVTAASPLAVRWCEEKINDKTNYRNGQG